MKVTKKLRDVTKEEFRKWKDINCLRGKINCSDCPFYKISCCVEAKDCWVFNKDMYSDKFLDQTIEVEAPDILDKEEKKYLSAVIKPFRSEIISIQLIHSSYYNKKGWIQIKTPDMNTHLPYCDITKMYLGMKDCKEYTLEELGL